MIKSFEHKGLEKFFQVGDKSGIQPIWLNMQAKYDLWLAEQESHGLEKIALLVPVPAFMPMEA